MKMPLQKHSYILKTYNLQACKITFFQLRYCSVWFCFTLAKVLFLPMIDKRIKNMKLSSYLIYFCVQYACNEYAVLNTYLILCSITVEGIKYCNPDSSFHVLVSCTLGKFFSYCISIRMDFAQTFEAGNKLYKNIKFIVTWK